MKNNIIELYQNTEHRTSHCHRQHRLLDQIAAVVDTIAMFAISVCTIFCIYIAYTML